MLVINVDNVNEALPAALHMLARCPPLPTRNGPARRAPGPVATVYRRPRERVLLDPMRNANPFFHFFEALWILAGQRDVEFLVQFNAGVAEFSDDGVVFHAPYGWRLRHEFGVDQIETVLDMLRRDPTTRQAVLQIWDCNFDLGKKSKDLPCNDLIFFTVTEGGLLEMTVCCRSNDALWGAYGANVVQFSMLQEYMAAQLNLGVGEYTQMSHNFHVYEANPFWMAYLKEYGTVGTRPAYDPYEDGTIVESLLASHELPHDHSYKPVEPYPFFEDARFDLDLSRFFNYRSSRERVVPDYHTDAFMYVVIPLLQAWYAHKRREYTVAQAHASTCAAADWRLAAMLWLRRAEYRFKEAKESQ